jgi:outer membrane protein assembly factor BamB
MRRQIALLLGIAVAAEYPVTAAGIKGGLVVCVGCDSEQLAELGAKEGLLVQGLESDSGKVRHLRGDLASRGSQGRVTVREFDGRNLPYVDNLVNLVIVSSDECRVSRRETERVLAPGGKALFLDARRATSDTLTKPVPSDVDDWTHYLYDASNNAVSRDTRIDAMRRLQWVGGPRWSRHHDHIASLTALVSSGGKLFYVFDEGKTSSVLLPSSFKLIARDAYNGVVLWKKPLPSWHLHLWPFKSGPAQLPRRLVAVGEKVYLPLGMSEPLSVLDAGTGKVLKTFPRTRAVDEVLVSDGMIYVLADPKPETYSEFTLGDTNNGRQKGRVARMFPWDRRVERLIAIDEASGETCWQREVIVAPLTLAVGEKTVFWFNGTGLVAVDKVTGDLKWRTPGVKAKKVLPICESPILVVYKDTVLFAGANGRMSAYAADTGKKLWENDHLRGGHFSPQDMLVIDDPSAGSGQAMVWSGAIVNPRSSGVFVGRDLLTGEKTREIPPMKVPYTFGHHRCHRVKATSRFILASKTGIEFYDIENRNERVNHWVRGGCLYGIMPANGLIYAPMHSCACHLDSKLTGFNALAPASKEKKAPCRSPRLVRGGAYGRGQKSEVRGQRGTEWPTYRADNARSGSVPVAVPKGLGERWKTPLGGALTALTVGCGKVFVAAVDEHRVYALDQDTGEVAWSFAAGGRIDSPPTVFRERAYFGSADGHVYALAAADGALAWRFRLAPDDIQLFSHGQLESVWPVHGSVTVRNGKVLCVGGRSSYLDGGLPFARLDALTGELEAESMIDNIDPGTGKDMQLLSRHSIMPSAIPDVLVCDENGIFMRVEQLSEDGKRVGSIAFDKKRQYEGRHIFSWAGLLEDSWLHRIYMSYGNGKLPLGTYLNWWEYGQENPDGRILVMDDDTVYSYGLKPKYHTWSSTFADYMLFSVSKTIETAPVTGSTIFDKKTGRTPTRKLLYNWTVELPFYVRAMVKAGDKLIVCGPEKVVDEKGAVQRYPQKDVLKALALQDGILDGARGSHLWVVSAEEGQVLEKHRLGALPVWDGMAVAGGQVYLGRTDGTVLCMSGEH